jgi:hypothetical protein
MRRSAPSSEPPDVSSRIGDTDRSKLHYALRDRSETDPAAAATRDFTIDSVMAATQNGPHVFRTYWTRTRHSPISSGPRRS